MSGNQKTHPERGRLMDFGLGKLDPTEAVQVETHLSECEECSATLLDLQADTFVDLVRRSDAVPLEPDKDATVDRACKMTAPARPGEVESDLPPELADHPRYRIVELLGAGGMGAVYKAEHKLMNRLVALKLIRHELVKHPQAVQRFRREVQAAARLSHPNIVTAYDAEQAGDAHFLVMEYVDGTDLAEVISQRGQLPVAEACRYIRQAAEGLQAAHELQMVHRDIKPQNLMVTPDGQVKILDFGLANFTSEAAVTVSNQQQGEQPGEQPTDASSPRLTSFGSTIGTPDYISPEQARDARSADIRSDVYSLGCTLYYLLSGQSLFPEGSALEKVKAHLEEQPRPLSELRDELPGGLEAVLDRMLAKDPRERFQTPAKVAEALGPFAEPSTAPSRSWWRRAGTLVATALAALLICAATVLYVQLGKTTIKFEIEDPTLAVRFDGDTITVDNEGQAIHIKPGEDHEFVVERNGLEVETDSFTLKKGQKIALRVTLVEGRVAVIPSRPDVSMKRPAAGPPADEPRARSDLSETKPPLTEIRRFEGHTQMINSVAVSPDGRFLLSAAQGGAVLLSNLETGKAEKTFAGHAWGVFEVSFSPDGTAFSCSTDQTARRWDVPSGQEIRRYVGHTGWVSALAVSPDGKHL
ncbi:MAG: protein kinase, partial [Pirellulaceae bacterium]